MALFKKKWDSLDENRFSRLNLEETPALINRTEYLYSAVGEEHKQTSSPKQSIRRLRRNISFF